MTPFGQTGPWRDYKSNDLIALAASGFMQITGEPDGPPMRQGNDQSHFPGAQYAAASILAALYHRDFNGGEGQHIDVSLQEALITYYTDAHPALAWMLLGDNVTRVGATSTLVIPLGAHIPVPTAGFPPGSSRPANGTPWHSGSTRSPVTRRS